MSTTQGASRLRVLMIGPFPQNSESIDGGVTAVVAYLSEVLCKHPTVELNGVRLGTRSAREVTRSENLGFPVYNIPQFPMGLLSRYRRQRQCFQEIIREVRPDIVHGQGADLAGYLAVKCAAPSVVTVHGLLGEDARYRTRRSERVRASLISALVERPTINGASDLILISPFVAQYYGGRIRARTHDIPNPVSEAFFKVVRRPEPGRILFAGRVIPRKGVLELVQALAGLGRDSSARLIVAGGLGDTEYVARIRAAVAHAGMADRVELRGLLSEPQMLEEFARSHLLVLPSYQETAPMVIQQAMASGLPAIASRICGIPGQIDDGVTGVLVEPGNVRDLQNRLAQLLADPAQAARIGEAAKDSAIRRYRASEVAEATISVYRNILRDRSARNGHAAGAV